MAEPGARGGGRRGPGEPSPGGTVRRDGATRFTPAPAPGGASGAIRTRNGVPTEDGFLGVLLPSNSPAGSNAGGRFLGETAGTSVPDGSGESRFSGPHPLFDDTRQCVRESENPAFWTETINLLKQRGKA